MSRQTIYHGGLPGIVDIHAVRHGLGGQIDWANVGASYIQSGVAVVVGVAGAAANATAIPVAALSNPLAAGTLLDFGGKKFARLTAAAAAGATSLTVSALATALVSTDTAYAQTSATLGKTATRKQIPALTAMVRESGGGGKMIPRINIANGETAIGLLYSNASEDDHSSAETGFGLIVAANLYENNLPDYANAAWATIKAELNATNGYQWETYADNRVAV